MSGVPVINESTSVVQIDGSQLQNGNYSLVWLSTTAIPGQLVTVRDATGYISSPQAIVVSTIGGATLSTGAHSSLIQQRFGYLSLFSESTNRWAVINENSFANPAASYSIKSVDADSIQVRSNVRATSYISTGHVEAKSSEIRSTFVANATVHASTLYINTYSEYLNTTPADYDKTVSGRIKVYNSVAAEGGAVAARGTISTTGFTLVGGTVSSVSGLVQIGGNLTSMGNIEAPYGLLLTARSFSTLQTGIFGPEVFVSSMVRVGNRTDSVYTGTRSTLSRAANMGGQMTLGPIPFNANGAGLHLGGTGVSTPSLQTSTLMASNAITTSDIGLSGFFPLLTLSSLSFSTASMVMDAGSMTVSSLRTNTMSTNRAQAPQTLTGAANVSQIDTIATNNLNFNGFTTIQYPTGSQVVPTYWTISSLRKNGTLLTPQKGAQFDLLVSDDVVLSSLRANTTFFSSFGADTLTVLSTFIAPSTTFFMSNTPINAPGGEFYGTRNVATSTLTTGTLYTNRITTAQPIQFGSAISSISTATFSSLANVDTVTSSLLFTKATLGIPVDYSTISISTPWIYVPGAFNMDSPPYNTLSGLGSYFNPLAYTGTADFAFGGNFIDPNRTIPRQLTRRRIDNIGGTIAHNRGWSGDGGPSRVAYLDSIPGQIASDSSNAVYFFQNSRYDTPIQGTWGTALSSNPGRGWKLRMIYPDSTDLGAGQYGGKISTLAGRNPWYAGNGVAPTDASIGAQTKMVHYGPSTLVLNDGNNFTLRIIKNGLTISTLAGNGEPQYNPYSGQGNYAVLRETLSITSSFLGPPGTDFTFTTNQMGVDKLTSSIIVNDVGNRNVHIVRPYAGRIDRFWGDTPNPNPGYTFYGPPNPLGPAYPTPLNILGMTIDLSNNMYFNDRTSFCIYKSPGIPSPSTEFYAGQTFVPGFGGDGGLALAATLNFPISFATDLSNNLYFFDFGNARVRKIDYLTNIITTVAGNGTDGYTGDGGLATNASISYISGIAVDEAKNIYIADRTNHTVRRIDAVSGVITTIIGTPGVAGGDGNDGPGEAALLNTPEDLVYEPGGNLYIADSLNYSIRVYYINENMIYLFAGNGSGLFNGDTKSFQETVFNAPECVTVMPNGDFVVCDTQNHLLRYLSKDTNTVSILAGTSEAGFNGDGPGIDTQLSTPKHAIFVSSISSIIFTDNRNSRIRQYSFLDGQVSTLIGTGDPTYNTRENDATLVNVGYPVGIAEDSHNNIYFGDPLNSLLWRWTPSTNIATVVSGYNGQPGAGPMYVVGPFQEYPAIDCTVMPDGAITVGPDNVLYLSQNGSFYLPELYYRNTFSGIIKYNLNTGIMSNETATQYAVPNIGNESELKQQLVAVGAPTGCVVDISNNLIIADSDNFNIRRSYLYGGIDQQPMYLTWTLNWVLGNANTFGGATLNGNVQTILNLGNPSGLKINFSDAPLPPSPTPNPFIGDNTPWFAMNLAISAGFSRIYGRIFVRSEPGQGDDVNIVNSNEGLQMTYGRIDIPNNLEATTISNAFNDTKTRTLFYNGGLSFFSDPALKEDVTAADLSTCVSTFSALPLRRYKYTDAYRSTFYTYDTHRLGFLTSEVEPLLPNSVQETPFEHGWGPSTIQTLDMSQIKYLHLGTTQSLQGQVSTLEATVAELESTVRHLATQRKAPLG